MENAARDSQRWREIYGHLFEAARRYGPKALADALPGREGRGVGLTTVYGKLKQTDGAHVLGIEDLVAIVNETGDPECETALRKIASMMGYALWEVPAVEAAGAESLHAQMTVVATEMGDMSRALLAILADGRVTDEEVVAVLEPEVWEAVGAAQRLLALAERFAREGAR